MRFLSFGILVLLSACVWSCGIVSIARAQSAMLYVTPGNAVFNPGQTFQMKIMVNTGGEQVNAVAAYLSYPQDQLEATGVDTSRSVMTLFAEKEVRNGLIQISGGEPSPGFSGIQEIAAVTFRVKATGTATIVFNADSAVLRNSDNQNIWNLGASGKGVYDLQTPIPVPSPSATSAPRPTSTTPIASTPTPTRTPTVSASATPTPKNEGALLVINTSALWIADDQIKVTWETNREADSWVQYGVAPGDYDFIVIDGGLTTTHEIVVPGVGKGISYYIAPLSTDSAGKKASGNELQPIAGEPVSSPSPSPTPAKSARVLLEGFQLPSPMMLGFNSLPILAAIIGGGALFFLRRRQSAI